MNPLAESISVKGVYDFTVRSEATGQVLRTYRFCNLTPTVGRQMIANNLTNASPTNVMKITHCALGTNATAPANADTKLGTETYRNAIASITNSANVAYATGFFTAVEVSGTFAEAGIFSNGTGSADSGVILSHAAISVTKSSSETLTLDFSFTLN